MKKILVTGGAGYIGSHTCKALSKAGMEPIVFDNLVLGHQWAVKWGGLEVGDLLDRDRIVDVAKKVRPEGVIHFAGHSCVGESVSDPAKYWRNNVAGTINLLDALVYINSPPVVFSSSCTVYGITDVDLISENVAVEPINPYGETKRAVEIMLKDYEVAADLRHIVLRYFNAAGSDADAEIGELHNPETHLIPLAIASAAGDMKALKIFGTDYSTADGTCVRDYIHVTDLADAHVRALNYLLDGGDSNLFNLGAGVGYSVREVVDAVGRIVGSPVPTEPSVRRPGDPTRLVADNGHAREMLHWEPVHSDLDNIVATAWRWYQMRKQVLSWPGLGADKLDVS